LQTEPPCPACHVSDPPLEFVERLWRDAPLAPVIRDAEPKKLALFRSRHRALRLVDLEPGLKAAAATMIRATSGIKYDEGPSGANYGLHRGQVVDETGPDGRTRRVRILPPAF
jgi:hypothetical protein